MSIHFTDEQRKVINHTDGDLLVSAAAGSGKTAVLVARVMRMLTDPHDPVSLDRLLIVTFTTAAAAQMKEKIEEQLARAIEENPENRFLEEQYRLVQSAHIQTNHSFSLYVLQNYITQLPGLDPGFRVADETEAQLIRLDILRDTLEYFYSEALKENPSLEASDFMCLVNCYSGARQDLSLEKIVLDVLKFMDSEPDPRGWLEEAVHWYEISPASGQPYIYDYADELLKEKRQDIERCMRKLEAALEDAAACDPGSKPAQSKKLAGFMSRISEIRSSLSKISEIRDYCRFAGTIEWPQGVYKLSWDEGETERKDLYDALKAEVSGIVKLHDLCFSSYAGDIMTRFTLPALRGLKHLIFRFLDAYRAEKNRRNILEIGDFEHYTLELLENEAVCRDLRQQFDYIYVDEYQDCNKIQETILQKIARKNNSGQSTNLFMVGDIKQSIYGFRQADPGLFLSKYKTYGTLTDTNLLLLSKNFRSQPEILDTVNYLFSSLMIQAVGGLDYGPDESLYPGLEERPDRAFARLTVLTADEQLSQDELTRQEARLIAGQILEELNLGTSLSDMVILLRATTSSQIYVDTLREYGIPAVSDSSENFYDTPEIRFVVNLLQTINNPKQDIPLFGVLSSEMIGFSEDQLGVIRMTDQEGCLFDALSLYPEKGSDEDLKLKVSAFLKQLDEWRIYASLHSVYDLLWHLYVDTNLYLFFASMPMGMNRAANLDLLISKAVVFENGTYHGLYAFLRYIEQLNKNRQEEAEAKVGVQDGQVVRIMTVHKSKGLEFPVVFAASLEHAWNFRDLSERMLMHKDGLIGVDQIDPDQNTMMSSLPKIIVQQKKKREMLAEEIRLLYVALTRARDRLYMSGTRKKSSDIQGQSISNPGWKIEESELLSCKNSLDLLEAVILHKGNHPFDYDVRTVQPEESEKMPSEEPQLQVVPGDLSEGEKAQLSYAYPYTDLSRIPQLLSVSAIKKEKMGQIEEELQSESTAESLDISDEKLSAADNRQGSVNLSGAERGTLFHNILASANIQLLKEHRVQDILDQLVKEDLIPKNASEQVPASWILGWSNSNIFYRMSQSPEVYREEPFIMLMSLEELSAVSRLTESLDISRVPEGVMIQGIIDLFFLEGEEWVLVDYKTDLVLDEAKLSGYRMQLELYQRAIENSTGRKVKEKVLYDVRRQKEIQC